MENCEGRKGASWPTADTQASWGSRQCLGIQLLVERDVLLEPAIGIPGQKRYPGVVNKPYHISS